LQCKRKNVLLAAKLLSEMILTSQADNLSEKLLHANPKYVSLCRESRNMQKGLYTLLETTYGLKIKNKQA